MNAAQDAAIQAAQQTAAQRFQPDYTPEQLENLGVYDSLYRGKGPRLASLGEWKPEWISEHDPKGWGQWYKRYVAGRRIPDEDERQMKRWLSFKARHGGPFAKNPTPRRGWALRNWAIDPANLVDKDQRNAVAEMLDAYKTKATQRHLAKQSSDSINALIKAEANLAGDKVSCHFGNLAQHAQAQAQPGDVFPVSCHERSTEAEPGQVVRAVPVLFKQANQNFLTSSATNLANTALQHPIGQTALSGVSRAYNNYMPQAGKNMVKKMVPHYGTPEQIQEYGMAGKWQPKPFKDQSFEKGFHIASHDQLDRQTVNGQTAERTYTAMQSSAPVQVTGTPLHQIGYGLSGGTMPGQTFKPGEQAYNTTNMMHQHTTGDEKINQNMTWGLTPNVPKFQPNVPKFNSTFQKQNADKQADLLPEVTLQEHQQRIADKITQDSPRMLVYHGLGSGKSLSALAAAEAAKKLYGGNYGVVVPASLKGNFEKEIKKFTRGSDPEVMSYTGLGMGKQFKDQPETLIMDEAARLRNPGSAMTQAAMRQAQAANRLLLLTGTPITNSPTDLAPLVAMLDGKNIDPKSFGQRYIGYKKVSPGWWNWLRGIKPGERPYIKNEKELREMLRGRVDYQPSKTPEGVNVNEEVVRVPLSKEQEKIQHAIRSKIPPGFLWKLDQEFPLSRDELTRLNSFLTGLRQVSLSTQPFRADKNPLKAFDQSSKLQKAFENLRNTLDSDPRKKAIIYSNFVDSGLAPYAAGLERAKIPHAFFHGGISPKARQAAVDAYNNNKLRALLIGPAGAEGISTKGTSLIQLLDPHWNEARTQQAQGRGLRFDSHRDLPEELKNVAVQRYLTQSQEPGWFGKWLLGRKRERTADEVLERLTAEKEELNDSFRNLLREVGSQK